VQLFTFDPEACRDEYAAQGWLQIKGGASEEFCDYVRGFVEDHREGAPLSGKGIAGAKDQLLLELPDEAATVDELFDTVASLCGLRRNHLTLSERHVKMYQADADPLPRAHKDRYASQVAVGISIDVPEGSHLVLYPDVARDENVLLRAGLVDELMPEERPEVVLRSAPELTIFDAPGDVQVFPGSSVWHLRRNCARTVMVYFKMNDFDCDPLGEDPTTERTRAQTLATLDDTDRFRAAHARLGRRLECVRREMARGTWVEMLYVNVWAERPQRISEEELALLEAVDDRSVDQLVGSIDMPAAHAEASLRRLASLGAVDLVS
jgi:hypothetical protein